MLDRRQTAGELDVGQQDVGAQVDHELDRGGCRGCLADHGATGYILKSALADEVIAAIRATAAGEAVLSSKVAGKLSQRIRESDSPSVTADAGAAARAIRAVLTERELEIFSRLASGDGSQTIGRELGLSTNTVSNHIASILSKLHLENRIQAAVQAVRPGIC